jgi:hypothetical protein
MSSEMRRKAERTIALLAAAMLGGAALAAPSPAPIPPALRSVIRPTAHAYWFDIVARGGETWRYDGRWCVPTGYRLFGGGRFLGIASSGGEGCGYAVVDRDAPPDAGELPTGAEPVFSPDGRYFVAAANVGRSDVDGVALWEVGRGTVRRRLAPTRLAGADMRVESWRGSTCVVLSAAGAGAGGRRLYELVLGRRVALHATPGRRPCAERKARG